MRESRQILPLLRSVFRAAALLTSAIVYTLALPVPVECSDPETATTQDIVRKRLETSHRAVYDPDTRRVDFVVHVVLGPLIDEIQDLKIRGTCETDDETLPIPFRDDGEGWDDEASDGIFTASGFESNSEDSLECELLVAAQGMLGSSRFAGLGAGGMPIPRCPNPFELELGEWYQLDLQGMIPYWFEVVEFREDGQVLVDLRGTGGGRIGDLQRRIVNLSELCWGRIRALPASAREIGVSIPRDELARSGKTYSMASAVGLAMHRWLEDQPAAELDRGGERREPLQAPPAAIDWDRCPRIRYEELTALLVPGYIGELPRDDGWGHPFEYCLQTEPPRKASDALSGIRSPGKDGIFEGSSYDRMGFPPQDLDRDIVVIGFDFYRSPMIVN